MLNHMLWIPARVINCIIHVRQLLLEAGDGFIIKIFLPVKRRRAVIGQQFARETRMDSPRQSGACSDPVSLVHWIRVRRVGRGSPRLIACSIGVGAEEPFMVRSR